MRNGRYRYRNKRVVCKGKIKTCPFCEEATVIDPETQEEKKVPLDQVSQEGYCKMCRRPLDKMPGDQCGHILAYIENENLNQAKDIYKNDENDWKQKHVILRCHLCNNLTDIYI